MEKSKIIVRREPDRIAVWAWNPDGRMAFMYDFEFSPFGRILANSRARLIGQVLNVDVEELK